MKVLLLSKADIEELISMQEAIEAVEGAFKAKDKGKVQMPPKSYVYLSKYEGDFRAMPAYMEEQGAAGVKVVNVHPRNLRRNLPTVMATIVLLSPETGSPLAIMDGTWITDLRTGAVGAVAAKYLARKDSESVGTVGAGAQSRTQLIGLNEVFNLTKVKINDRYLRRRKYAEEISQLLNVEVELVRKAEEAVKGMDIVVTVTPSRNPIVLDSWVSVGTHINAIGADAPGKQELESRILKRAKVVVDDWEQALHSGEVNVPISEGHLTREDIYSDIGRILAGKDEGRTSEKEVTVFDSTGLAIQDLVTAWRVYRKAEKNGMGRKITL